MPRNQAKVHRDRGSWGAVWWGGKVSDGEVINPGIHSLTTAYYSIQLFEINFYTITKFIF